MSVTSSGDANLDASAAGDAALPLAPRSEAVSGTEPRERLTSRDLLRFEMADDPQLSPDGTEAAWVRTWVDAAANRYRSEICLTTLDGGATRALTPGRGLEIQPRWSPDGRFIAFLAPPEGQPSPSNGAAERAVSVVGKGMQLFVAAASGGEPRQLTALAGGVQAPVWSPDGSRLAFLSFVDPSRGLEALDEPLPDTPYERFNRDVLIARRVDWKMDGTGYVGDYRRMAAWVPFEPSAEPSPPPVTLLTCGEFDVAALAWSPDGATLAAVGSLVEAIPSRRRAIFLLDPDAPAPTAAPEPLFCLEDVRHSALAWSPDGSRLALYGHNDPTVGHYGNQQLWIVDAASGEGRCLTRHLDRTWANAVWTDVGRYGGGEGPYWSADGRHLFGLLSSDGAVRLCRVDSEDGRVDALTPPDTVVAAFTVDARGERAALLVWEALVPAALFTMGLDGEQQDLCPLLDPNEALLRSLQLSAPERFAFESGGETIEGWVIPPVHAETGERYPTILYHGGGPGGMRAGNFIFEYQLYAAQGYGVLYINTRGCQGYGEAFCTAILGDWGGADHADNMRGLDVACQRFAWIDPQRLLTAGGSYGGYQVNWILGHDHRFKAAVSDRSVFNRFSSYGTSDIGFLREFEFDDGPPWETPAAYLRQSPLTFLGEARTPTLVVHSALDLRCPIEQGEQLYLALKRLGVPTELVRFPNESHGLSRTGRPWHRVYRLDRYLEWFARWLD